MKVENKYTMRQQWI